MGFNRRYVNLEYCIKALENNNLRGYYGKSDMLIFEDDLSSKIYELFRKGKTDAEILLIINQNMEEQTNEVYQSNQSV
jgi:hypothetical protein